MEDSMPREEVIGVVIGAVALFSLISVIPIMIMWYHRRRAAQAMTENPTLPPQYQLPMQNVLGQPVSVDRWLEDQTVPAHAQHYGQDICPICLCSLGSSPYPTPPDPAMLSQSHDSRSCTCGAHTPPSDVLVLNRCKHAFHLECLKSYFEYRRYKCPICQASYSPEVTRG